MAAMAVSGPSDPLEAAGCDVRRDRLVRGLYATDASIYQVEPAAVAFPRSTTQMSDVIRTAADAGMSVTLRGAGTGLVGGALGEGLVVDASRHLTAIDDLDLEAGTVCVGAGVVLDRLNAFLAPHGLWFGPDVATSSRATLGGMIANNSSGARAPVYGTTTDHVAALELVLADGTVAWVGAGADGLPEVRRMADEIVGRAADAIAERMPEGLVKRWPGYGLDDALRSPGDLSRLVAGSEGTLAAITRAVVRVVARPRTRRLVVIAFASVEEAMEATVELLDVEAAAIEHVDRLLFDQTRGQRAYQRARDLLDLDRSPCEALLVVELFDDDGGRADEVARRNLGLRTIRCDDPGDQELVWTVRRAGLSLLTGRPGTAKPTTGVEDVCVRPQQLPEFVRGVREILDPLGLEASFYGHAAAGALHVRPILDLHTPDGVRLLQQVVDEVSELVLRFKGSLTAEHGVGIARTRYLPEHLGPELIEVHARIKTMFDPSGVMNPGKIVDIGRWRPTDDLRLDRPALELPLAPVLGFVDKDGSFVGNLEQCNGNGACRKLSPTMCPTYRARPDEIESTRGRANTIRAALEGRFGPPREALASPELEAALSDCLSCKACTTECPTNVDMTQLKAELMWQRHREHGPRLVDRLVASADLLGRVGCAAAPIANAVQRARPVRRLLQAATGLVADRPLPPYVRSRDRFDRWFARRERAADSAAVRGEVILWDDTWVRYHEPGIGRAAVRVLEAAGFTVRVAEDRRCCGRPAASRGLLDRVRAAGEHNLALLDATGDLPIVFLEPSCWSMFVDEYRQLELDGADRVAARCVMIEPFLAGLLARHPDALPIVSGPLKVTIHPHCHAAALSEPTAARDVAAHLVGSEVELLDTACCGMAGAFGMLETKQELSRAVARPLLDAVARQPEGAEVVASGTSCRHQVAHLEGRRVRHLVEVLADALADGADPDGAGNLC
jgi:FAD/FMN-containing dehydrogenase/Fe-S oxidoreductase